MRPLILPEIFITNDICATLKPRDRSKCERILSEIVRGRPKAKANGLVPLARKKLRKLAGGNYKRYIRRLLDNRVIQENPKFCYKTDSPLFKKAFCKSYRLLSPYSESAPVIHFDKFAPKTRLPVDRSTADDQIAQIIKANYKGLRVENPIGLTVEESYEAYLLAEKIGVGVANAKMGKNVGRYYHTLLSAKGDVRSLVRKDGRPLHDYDMQAAFAADLLAVMVKPHISPEEFSRFLAVIKEKDIYAEIGKISPFKARVKGKWVILEGRKAGKIAIRRFKFSKRHDILKSGKSKNPAAIYFKSNFKEIYDFIVAQDGKAFSCQMQNLEASLFCKFLVYAADNMGIWMLPMHDGWLCATEEAGETLKYIFEKEFHRQFGFTPQIICKSQNKEKIASANLSEVI